MENFITNEVDKPIAFDSFLQENSGKYDLVQSIIRDVLKASESEGFNDKILEKYDLLMSIAKLLVS